MTSPTPPIVDAHAHVFLAAAMPQQGVHARWRGDASAKRLLAAMHTADVGHALLVPVGKDPAYVRSLRGRHAARFSALGVQDGVGLSGDWVGDGVRLRWLGDDPTERFEALPLAPLLRRLAALEVPVSFYGDRHQLVLLETALRALPDLTVMINHLGAPLERLDADEHGRPTLDVDLPLPTLPVLERCAEYPNVAVAFSGLYAISRTDHPHMDLRPHVGRVLELFGPRRVLWGSDFPWIADVPGYAATLELVDVHLSELDPAERAAVLGGNAVQLFGIGPVPVASSRQEELS